MRRCVSLGLSLLISFGVAGCAAPPDPQQKLSVVESERDRARAQLATAQNQNTALQERVQSITAANAAARAETEALKKRVGSLEEANAKLMALMEERGGGQMQRPESAASPLPPTVDQALLQFATGLGDRVAYDRARGGLTFANDRLFQEGSDAVRPDAVAGITQLATVLSKALKDNPDQAYDVVVVGHTDATPITKPETQALHATNWHLSVHRAIAVKTLLVKAGMPEARLAVMGYSSFRPISDDPARNRRVEVFLVPKGAIQSLEPVRPGRR